MNEIGMTEILAQMRALSTQAQGRVMPAEIAAPQNSFQSVLKSSVDTVNSTQQQASSLASAFEAGEPNIDLANVMVAMQKANVSFQAMVQVRNKLVSAYQEVMNMQV
jgi:flagellar hook-basal body complex protein FliE